MVLFLPAMQCCDRVYEIDRTAILTRAIICIFSLHFLKTREGRAARPAKLAVSPTTKHLIRTLLCPADDSVYIDVHRNVEVSSNDRDDSDSVRMNEIAARLNKASRRGSIQNIRQDKNGFTNCSYPGSPSPTAFTRCRSVLR